MCGIFGIVYRDGLRRPCDERLKNSADSLSHRGPDGSGLYQAPGIGLAHTRLSLVDISERSDQPMWDSSGRYCLVYNGEIYNFKSLRHDLESRGVKFRTTSDTEVLLQCLVVDGPTDSLPRLHGMFAFAFYDRLERRLLLARDRFGIKPLLIYQDDEKFLFASEVKAMRPWIKLQPNGFQMIRYLMNYGAPVRNSCFFDNIEILPAGAVVTITPGKSPEHGEFLDLPEMIDRDKAAELEGYTKGQIVDHVDELLQNSVERMLFADAPVGALCSGGVDSSLIMAMAARKHSNLAIFHADVVGPLSEHDAARRLAEHLNLNLLVIETKDQDFIDLIPEVIDHYEQPFYGHPHSVPFMMVSKLVREHGVKGVLTGEGSDECFLGYDYLALEPVWEGYKRQLGRLRQLVHRIPGIGHRLCSEQTETPNVVADMLGQFEVALDRRRARELFAERMGSDAGLNIRTVELLANHLRTLLHRNDTMGMSAGIEARFPFLDETLVHTAINLPLRHKIQFSPSVWEKGHPFLRDKWVLRRVADRYLPKMLSQRKKLGFEVSAYRRLAVGKAFFQDAFVTNYFRLSRRETDMLLASADARLQGKLMMLEVWGQIAIEGATPQVVRESLRQHTAVKAAA